VAKEDKRHHSRKDAEPESQKAESLPRLPDKILELYTKPDSYKKFSSRVQTEIIYNLGFIDPRDYIKALSFSREQHPDAKHPALFIHEYYLENKYKKGRLPADAFSNYKKARSYAEKEAVTGKPLSDDSLLKISSLVITGDIKNASAMMRGINSPVFVRRLPEEIETVFDLKAAKPAYKTTAPIPPVRGFFSGEVPDMEASLPFPNGRVTSSTELINLVKIEAAGGAKPKNLQKTIHHYSLIALLRALDVSGNASSETQQILDKEVEKRLLNKPPLVPGKLCAVVFSTDNTAIKKHVGDVIDHYMEMAQTIIDHLPFKPGSKKYINAVCILAARIARAVDMGHLAKDGMCRTSLLTERFILKQFGLHPPPYIIDFDPKIRKYYENGTYRDEIHRARKLANAIKKENTVSEMECRAAVEKLKIHLRTDNG
jgi:hypothetical protein